MAKYYRIDQSVSRRGDSVGWQVSLAYSNGQYSTALKPNLRI